MADEWISQFDLDNQIKDSQAWDDDFILIFQKRESYIEYYVGYCFALGPQQAKAALGDSSWGDDLERSKPMIIHRTANHFLSRAFRSFVDLSRTRSEYFDGEGNVIAKLETGDPFVTFQKTEAILVKRHQLLEFLEAKKKVMVFAFRSHRFSEKTPEELGIEPIKEDCRDARWHYLREIRDISNGQNVDIFKRERVNTFSFMFGKSLILSPKTA